MIDKKVGDRLRWTEIGELRHIELILEEFL